MALGGTLENAILVGETEIRTTGGLRYKDEFVRHKILDLIGDLALLGRPVCAKIIAIRAGHMPHLQFIEKLRRLS
jgi:UDP-3-O-[3-hydroxymyristoyl] N-acetylglucosamine deacetylase